MARLVRKVYKYGFLVVIVLLTGLFYFLHAYDYLSLNRPGIPGILVVEGWVPDEVLLKAKVEFVKKKYRLILTTGYPYYEGILMGSNGRMEFNIDKRLTLPLRQDSVGVWVRGTKSKGAFPHLVLYADSVKLADFYVSRQKKFYSFPANLDTLPRMIRIEFDNDAYTQYSDRNLYFYSVSVGNQIFPANAENVFYYVRMNGKYFFEKQFSNNMATNAAQFLRKSGIPDSLVIPVETMNKIKSRTFTMALDVKAWLARSKMSGQSITVFTEATHARRSGISYKKAFGKSAHIGIISSPDPKLSRYNWWKSFKGWKTVLYETVGLLYVSVFV